MEEKERFEYYPEQNQLYDNIINELYCLGIEQDKTRLVDFLNLMNKDWRTLYERNIELREENQQLKQQLAITEKALELACERVKYFEEMQDREMGHFEFFGYDNEYDLQAIIEQYKQQALTHQDGDKGE